MLVLTRKVGENISASVSPQQIARLAAHGLGLDLAIHLTKLAGNRASIGIEAPPAVAIVRGELPRKENPNDANDTAPRDAV